MAVMRLTTSYDCITSRYTVCLTSRPVSSIPTPPTNYLSIHTQNRTYDDGNQPYIYMWGDRMKLYWNNKGAKSKPLPTRQEIVRNITHVFIIFKCLYHHVVQLSDFLTPRSYLSALL